MYSYLLAMVLAITSLVVAITALILTIRGLYKRITELEYKIPPMKSSQENFVEIPEIRKLSMRRINALAEAAVLLGAEAIMLFDNQGLVVESYNMAEEHGVRTAASLAELISILKRLGFPTRILIFGDDTTSFIIELGKIGDVTPYCFVMGGPKLVMNAEYAREILQEYIKGVINRRGVN